MGDFTDRDRKMLESVHDAMIVFGEYRKSHEESHEIISKRLDSHSSEIRAFSNFVHQWRGTVKLISISGIVGAVLAGAVYFIWEGVKNARW